MVKLYKQWLFLLFAFSLVSVAFGQKNTAENEKALQLIRTNASGLKISEADIAELYVTNAYLDEQSGLYRVYAQQTYKGIGVYNTIQVMAFKDGKLVSLSGSRLAKIASKINQPDGISTLTAEDAVRASARHLNISFNSSTARGVVKEGRTYNFGLAESVKDAVTAEEFWFPAANGTLRLGWQVQMSPKTSKDLWHVKIDATTGEVIDKQNLTISCNFGGTVTCTEEGNYVSENVEDGGDAPAPQPTPPASTSYRVVPYPAESPAHNGGVLTVVNNPVLLSGVGNNATTLGWHSNGTTDYLITRGNNVWAKDDVANNNETGIGASDTSSTPYPNLTFTRTPDFGGEPSGNNNLRVATTNLFYWNNLMHDISYQYGFTEAAGNFQTNNQGRGGVQGDAVFADAQDGGGTDNANFSATADGTAPRMQMYLWSPTQLMTINSPAGIAGAVAATESQFDGDNSLANFPDGITSEIVYYEDITGGLHEACSGPSNIDDMAGKIVMIDRGNCEFDVKVKNAQIAGAAAVIMVNNLPDAALVNMAGDDVSVTIPAVFISLESGQLIKDQILDGTPVEVTLKLGVALDGDLDAGIMAHEYTHGISGRLTGGAANPNCLNSSETMGEGWSDFYGLMVTTNWATTTLADIAKPRGIGTYVVGQNPLTGGGIRKYPYTTDLGVNPWMYGYLSATGGETHDVGELWCTALWEMVWELNKQSGISANLFDAAGTGGNIVGLRLVTEGLKLQPCNPGFLDGRDAILKADSLLYGGAHAGSIWNAFAKRGMGVKAIQGTANNTSDQFPSFETPTGIKIIKTADKDSLAKDEVVIYTIQAGSKYSAITNAVIRDTLPASLTYISSTGGTYDAATRVVSFSVASIPANTIQKFTVTASLNAGYFFTGIEHLNDVANTTTVPAATYTNAGWASSTVRKHSTTRSYFAIEDSLANVRTLTTTTSYALKGVSTLSFWHFYNTEAGWDGGVVEISTDGGTTWKDLGPYMTLNGYNGYISSANLTSIAGKQAFSGSSNGVFFNTLIDLSSFSGKTAKFRFKSETDANTKVEGWYIDDINIKSQAGIQNVVGLYGSDGVVSGTGTTWANTLVKDAPVPLKWLSFTAEKKAAQSLLKWETAVEINTSSFTIQRSADGLHFENIGQVSSTSVSGLHNYNFTDATPYNGINYYRIQQADKDGKKSWSITKTVYFGKIGAFAIAPNPAKSYIYVSVPAEAAGKSTLALIDVSGRIIKQYALANESSQIQLPLALPNGVYNVRIVYAGSVFNQKLVIE